MGKCGIEFAWPIGQALASQLARHMCNSNQKLVSFLVAWPTGQAGQAKFHYTELGLSLHKIEDLRKEAG